MITRKAVAAVTIASTLAAAVAGELDSRSAIDEAAVLGFAMTVCKHKVPPGQWAAVTQRALEQNPDLTKEDVTFRIVQRAQKMEAERTPEEIAAVCAKMPSGTLP